MTVAVRVATLNVWGRRGDWERRRTALAAGFSALGADLIAFQEVVRTADYDQVCDVVGPGMHVVHHSDRELGTGADDVEAGQGISIASRWPVGEVREVDLKVTPRTHDFACSALVALIETPVGPLLFVNHLPSWQLNFERERELQAAALGRVLEELATDRPSRHVILVGDFDADPAAASVRFWTGRQSLEGLSVCYRDAWESLHPHEPGHTFTPENPLVADPDWPFRRIDYILVRCGEHGGPTLAIRSCERIFDHPVDGVQVSDHYGVSAELAAIA